MTRKRGRIRALTVSMTLTALIVAGVLVAVLSSGGSSTPAPSRLGDATTDARAFLARYVQPNGRVSRLDQGGDTVSEGQAYGLLIAQIAGQPRTFARIWQWTHSHLQESDGLLAWQANASGEVESQTPASDADLLTAWALSRASGRGSAGYHAQARRIADAILADETTKTGPLLLAAGPWATGSPASLDPSYWSGLAFAGLARFTGNPRWTTLANDATSYTEALTGNGAELPPDWAKLEGATATAEPAPNGSAPSAQYGLDAQRLVVWSAASCNATDRKLAADWWHLLSPSQSSGALALSQSGSVINSGTNALPYVAAAASAQAAGDPAATSSLLDAATKVQEQTPTYYGGAWLALGQALLTGRALGGCAGKASA